MSVITSVVVIAPGIEDEAMAAVNGWLAENDERRQQLTEISTEASGGWKVPSVHLWVAGFNKLDVCGLADAIRAAPWCVPEAVVAYFESDSAGTFAICPGQPDEWKLAPPF